MRKVVVVGGGQAGFSVVSKLRRSGFDGDITLFCREPEPPYQRPPLSKAYLLGQFEKPRLYLRPTAFYAENGIELKLNASVNRIIPDSRAVESGGELIPYDDLVLATGANPKLLPAAMGGRLAGVHTVRNVHDIDTIEPRLRKCSGALIVGGGYIGLEVASVAAKMGLNVTLVEVAERILQRVAAPETSRHICALHRTHGVEILEGVGLTRLVGNGRVKRAILNNGAEIDTDIVIAGIGIDPCAELAQGAGIAVENGVRTDSKGRTSIPNVWAAGDCASFPWKGGRIRLESVQNAIDQSELVAENIIGAEKDYRPTPWFWSDQYDAKLQIAGLGNGYDRIISRENQETGAVSFWYFVGDKLLAVDAVNDPKSYMVGKRLLEMDKSFDPARVSDPSTNLKMLLRSG